MFQSVNMHRIVEDIARPHHAVIHPTVADVVRDPSLLPYVLGSNYDELWRLALRRAFGDHDLAHEFLGLCWERFFDTLFPARGDEDGETKATDWVLSERLLECRVRTVLGSMLGWEASNYVTRKVLREKRRRVVVSSLDAFPGPGKAPQEQAITEDLVRAIAAGQNAEEREVLSMWHEEYTAEETAEKLGKSRRTVYRRRERISDYAREKDLDYCDVR